MRTKIKNNWKKILFLLISLLVILLLGLYIFLRVNTYSAMPEAISLLDDEQIITEEDWIIALPTSAIKANIVLYQGGLVETEAYLPLAKSLSEQGYRVFIPYMPLNLAILNTNAISAIKEEYDSDKDWWIAGHSLGGASASIFLSENYEEVTGIIFLASYPSSNSDLSELPLSVLSIAGSNDTIVNAETYEETRQLLPEDTVYMSIDGGNHSQFGYYGFQDGDGESSLSRKEQHNEVVQSIIDRIEEN